MLAEGKVFYSKSPAGTPILFVTEPDGRLRSCVDYPHLNKLTILNKSPLPVMTELRDTVAGTTIFTKLDRKDSYYSIWIKKENEWKTAFRAPYWHYEYKVMPFGLVNAPAPFQVMMNTILWEFLDHRVVVYLDDILICSKTIEEHEAQVKQVLARLERLHFAVSLKKSLFHVKRVEFRGYIVGKSGVTMSEKKAESILNWRARGSVKNIQIVIGFITISRRFMEPSQKFANQIPIHQKPKEGTIFCVWEKKKTEPLRNLSGDLHRPLF